MLLECNDPTSDWPTRSFLPVDPVSHFPIQNLPFGVFFPSHDPQTARVGAAIGEWIVDLTALERQGLLTQPDGRRLFDQGKLNPFMAQGRVVWRSVRRRIAQLLAADEPTLRDDDGLRKAALHRQSDCRMGLPCEIGDYTDFYSSRHHAENVGTMLRGAENALNPNWLHLPVAYHGRSSSIIPSGTPIRRPCGQTKTDASPHPTFGPTKALDLELEMGFFIGPGNSLGHPIPISQAEDHIFGLVLVNDWSARDLQKWEYVPLGPFLAKNFATTISPWVVTLDALAPFRIPAPKQDPSPPDYLIESQPFLYDVRLEVWLTPHANSHTAGDHSAERICVSNLSNLYWTFTQQTAHHTVNGCPLRPGDLLATGTISGSALESRGCLLERTWGGREPLQLASGAVRRFLEDGDQVDLTGYAQAPDHRIGFGRASGLIVSN